MSKPASAQQVGGRHYKDFVIQPAEFIHKNRIGFLEGNVIKYVCRHATKNGVADLLKARHYIDLLLEWQYGGHADGSFPADAPGLPEAQNAIPNCAPYPPPLKAVCAHGWTECRVCNFPDREFP